MKTLIILFFLVVSFNLNAKNIDARDKNVLNNKTTTTFKNLNVERPSKHTHKNDDDIKDKYKNTYQRTEFPYLVLFPVSIIAFTLSYDYFKEVDNINDQIKQYDMMNLDSRSLNAIKNRKQNAAYFLLLAGIANTIITFKPVKVYADQHKIGFLIKF
ncbi:hypothetical protein Calab_1469 [Caldithrix abyssi DSM 13497]|uniref:DUF5683 domain-containing protein n=1 Tax=Caldithrix abyssi DSM 13497 TaxID=880073 RepID=H1XPW4_CALAY|nr:hypothetical protein [Caldithrix abyssi]APF20381.1 hypothetical protein Cabys_3635 [Caldithrix abyssi DSM 13497]EHO41090.1 hypothetical protein Calab_1469 [Caldithrix abyssi DSM 13497]